MNLPRQDGPQQRETHHHGSQPWTQTGSQHGLTTAAQLSARPSSSAKNRRRSHECHETDRRTSDDEQHVQQVRVLDGEDPTAFDFGCRCASVVIGIGSIVERG